MSVSYFLSHCFAHADSISARAEWESVPAGILRGLILCVRPAHASPGPVWSARGGLRVLNSGLDVAIQMAPCGTSVDVTKS